MKKTIGFVAIAMSLSSIAFAESTTTTSSPATPAGPQVSSPYWNPQGDSDDALPFGEGLMEKTVLAVPAARADAVVAQWQYRRANHTLNVSADNMHRDFIESEEYTGAVDAMKKAYRELENARLDALKGIRGSDDYTAIESMRKSINEQIADERDQDEPSLDRLMALAQLKLDSIAPIRQAERDKIESSDAVRDAKDRLITAAQKVAKMEREHAHDVRDSIELADARKAIDDARIAKLASAAYLDETRIARDIAIRYSYLSRGIIRPYNNSYTGYGYSGGYYGGGGYYGYGGYGYGATNYGFNNVGYVTGGVTGSTPIGGGSNTFTGRGGNAIMGGGPSSARQSGMPSAPGSNVPFNPIGTGGIPNAIGTSPNP